MLALPSVRQIDATFIRFWGASTQFTCWFQCSLLPPCLPYLQKKKKETYVILNTHLPHWIVQSLRTQTHIPTLNSPVPHLTYVCAYSRHGLIRLDINRRKIAPAHLQRFLDLSFAICFLDCFACGWQKQDAIALMPLQLHCNHMRRESIQCEGRPNCHKMCTSSVSVQPWVETVYTPIHSFKKEQRDIRFKGKLHCRTESSYDLIRTANLLIWFQHASELWRWLWTVRNMNGHL